MASGAPKNALGQMPRAAPIAARPSATCVGALRLLEHLVAVRQKLVLPLAGAASALHARSAWLACGYRSRDDFVRERFDRSGRWFLDLVRLQHEIVRLPGLSAALCGADADRPLGHKAALCIARVATRETADYWIATARTLPLQELQNLVRHALQGMDGGTSLEPATQGMVGSWSPSGSEPEVSPGQQCIRAEGTDEPGTDPATPRVRVRLHGPPEVRLAYDAARDLHAAVSGRESGVSAFVEALVLETASAGGELSEDLRASAIARWQREARSRQTATRPAMRAGGSGATGVAQDRSTPGVIGTTLAARRALQTLRDFDALGARLGAVQRKIASHERASAGLALSDTYVRHIERLTSILAGLIDLEGRLDIAIAALLLELHERRAWKSLGFAGLEDCAESLGVGASTARHRVAVARRTRRFEPVQRAYESGRLGSEAALWVARRLEKLPERTTSATPWIEHARLVSVKHLRDEEKCTLRETLLGHVPLQTR